MAAEEAAIPEAVPRVVQVKDVATVEAMALGAKNRKQEALWLTEIPVNVRTMKHWRKT